MLFNSLEFLLFFPVAVGVYYATPGEQRWMWLLASSYFFYGWWEPAYLLLIVASTLVDYGAGRLMARSSTRTARWPFLLASLASNLGLLFAFKYLGFFSRSVEALLAWTGNPAALPTLDVLLPVGISFYTFQTIAYSVDVYRGQQAAERHLGYFALYVSFWPQLVAGPIERSQDLLPQFKQTHAFDYARVTDGLKLMAWGLFKKVVIADRLAIFVQAVFSEPGSYAGPPVIIAAYFFTFQIYCDFSGYSDMAIGAARVMGIELQENFRRPYFAKSIGDYWRRWHISLSRWFKDYIYIPLGGSRVPRWRWLVNILAVFLVSGLWHGAAWTFVAYGVVHGVALNLSILTQRWRDRVWSVIGRLATWRSGAPNEMQLHTAGLTLRLPRRLPILGHLTLKRVRELVAVVVTFHLLVLMKVVFRAGSLTDAGQLYWGMIDWSGGADFALPFSWIEFGVAVGSIALMETVHLLERRENIRVRLGRAPAYVRWSVYVLLVVAILTLGRFDQEAFLYFQF
jgi:D-alanyl-lipoteichoic acid acyltransferase DltB (MBOAT superfamily)